MNYIDFAKKVKTKYPEYNDMDDRDLAERLVKKYPEYSDITFESAPKPAAEQGNIDLNNRPVVKNADSSISTVRSMSFNENGQEVLIPTVSDDGRIMGDQEAIDNYHKTGKYLGKFGSIDDANAAAEQIHKDQQRQYAYVPQPGDIPIKLSEPVQLGPYGEDIARQKANEAANIQNFGTPMPRGEDPLKPVTAGILNLAGFATELPKLYSRFEQAKYANVDKQIEDLKNSGQPQDVIENKIRRLEVNKKMYESSQNDPSRKAIVTTMAPLADAAKQKLMSAAETVYPMAEQYKVFADDLKNIKDSYPDVYSDLLNSIRLGNLDTRVNWFGTQALLRGDKKSAELSQKLVDEYNEAQKSDYEKLQSLPMFKDLSLSGNTPADVGKIGSSGLQQSGMKGATTPYGYVPAIGESGIHPKIELKTPGVVRKMAKDVARMAPGLLESMAATAVPVVGAPAAFLGWASQGAGQAYQDAVSQGADPEKARVPAAIAGPIYAGIEGIQIGHLKDIPTIKKTILQKLMDYGVDVGKEVNEEGLQGIATTVATEIGKGNANTDDLAKKAWQSYLDNSTQAALSMAVISGAGHGIGAIASRDKKPATSTTVLEKPQVPNIEFPSAQPINNSNLQTKNEITGAPNLQIAAPRAKALSDFGIQSEKDFWALPTEKRDLVFPELSKLEQDKIVNYSEPMPPVSVPNEEPSQTPISALKTSEQTQQPTEAQKEAGNYKKEHIRRDGFDISIENPKGSIRSGTDPGGQTWSQQMNHDYGYIKGTVGKDKDLVDVFVNRDNSTEGGPVFVVNQVDPKTGKFDEHKVMLGFNSEEEARQGYLSNYEKGWSGLGSIVPMSTEQFKEWVKSDQTKKPAVAQSGVQPVPSMTAGPQAPAQLGEQNEKRKGRQGETLLSQNEDVPTSQPVPPASSAAPESNNDGLLKDFGFVTKGASDIENEQLEKSGNKNISIGAIDLLNLGALNKAVGHEKANEIYREIGKILKANTNLLVKGDSRISLARVGGDEIYVKGINVEEGALNQALAKAQAEIDSYVGNLKPPDQRGGTVDLLTIKHPKEGYMPTGAGSIDFGTASVKNAGSVQKAIEAADQASLTAKAIRIRKIAQKEVDNGNVFVYNKEDGRWTTERGIPEIGQIIKEKIDFGEWDKNAPRIELVKRAREILNKGGKYEYQGSVSGEVRSQGTGSNAGEKKSGGPAEQPGSRGSENLSGDRKGSGFGKVQAVSRSGRPAPRKNKYADLTDNPEFDRATLGVSLRRRAAKELGLFPFSEQYQILTGKASGKLDEKVQNWLVKTAEDYNNEEGWTHLGNLGLNYGPDSPVLHDDIRGFIADSPLTEKDLGKFAKKLRTDEERRNSDEEAYAAEQISNQNPPPKQIDGIPATNPGVLKEEVTWYFPPHEGDPAKRKAIRGTKSQRITYFVGNGYTSLTKIQRGRKPNPTILWKLQKSGDRLGYIELATPEEMEFAKKQIERKTKSPAFMREEIEDENGTTTVNKTEDPENVRARVQTDALIQATNENYNSDLDKSDLELVVPDPGMQVLFEAARAAFPRLQGPYVLKLSDKAKRQLNFAGVTYGNTIFINANTKNPADYILTHEIIHYLREQHPHAYRQLDAFVDGLLTDQGQKETDKRAEEYAGKKFKGREEIIADIFATHAHEKSFWRDMYDIAPEMVRDILKAFKAILDKFIAAGSKQKRWDEAWFKDAVLARKAVAQFVADMSALENGDMEVADAFNGAPSFMMNAAQTNLFDNLEELPLFQNQKDKTASKSAPAQEAKKTEPKPVRPPAPKAPKEIEDFGKKIGGARKDYYAEYADKFERAKNADVAEVPLSQSWPEPDYNKLLEAGNDPWIVGFVRAARDEVPTKPQKSYRLKRWADDVLVLRNFAENLLSGNLPKEKLQEALKQQIVGPVSMLTGRAELYQLFGHDKSLKGVDFEKHHYSIYHGEKDVTRWVIEQRRTQASAFSNMPHELGSGSTKEEAIADFKAKYDALGEKAKQPKKTEFLIYRRRDTGKFYIVKKMGAQKYYELKSFDTAKEASEYRAAHQAELEAQLERWKQIPNERREFNRERIGEDHRGGVDVTPEMFSNTFGFRGVEFGNWVNNAERQDNLNRAFDSLYDLANILKIPTRAISLNGELGIGFGSRGHGGKRPPSAHYESDRIVINLTKKNGPGSLAHEWWHAFDNYISRRRGKPLSFVTDKPFALPGDTTRQELVDAVKGVLDAIDATDLGKRSGKLDKRRTDAYWATTIEQTARSFEGYVIEKLKDMGATNDYLANNEEASEWLKQAAENMAAGDTEVMNDYPYLLADEMPGVKKALDKLFSVIKTREEGDRVPMFMREDLPGPASEVVGTEREQLDEIYRKARATKPTLMQRIFHTNKSFREYKDQLAAEMIVPISTRLKKIGPQFKEALRKFEYNLAQSEYKDTKAVEPWLKALKKMDPADQSDLDLALKNGDTAKTEAIITKYKLEKEWAKVREVLDGIHFRSIEAGFDINYIRDYYPRKVIDPKGLIEVVSGEEEFGQINDMIRKEQEALGRALTEGEKAEVVNTFLARPDRIIEAPGALKKRSIRMIDNEIDKFYDYSPSALLTYLHEMNKAIEQRKFFGLDKNKTEADAEEFGLWNEESRPRQGQIISDITDGINRYVLNAIQDHKLSDEQQDELVGLLKSRFNYKPTGNTMQMIKNLGYLTTMGSGFSSFVSQLGDLAWAFYVAGPIRAAKAFGKSMVFKSELKKEDLGLERIAEEFRTSRGLGKALNFVFKTTLLQRMDNVGKESLINGLLERYRKEAKTNDRALRDRAEFIFGKDEAQQVLDDLAAGKTTENIKYMLFNRLLDFQPIALSEMPALYLKAPNGRILYMLKTFTIKQLDVFRNEGLSLIRQGIADGNPKMVMKGMRNLTYLIALFIMANAAADQIKDWLFGRKPSFSDKVYDNIFRLFGLSRFLLWEIRRTQDIPSAIAKMVAPPADILEMPLRDAVKILKDDGKDFGEKIKNAETWKTIPYLGKHYYWWLGGGREGEMKRQEKNSPYADYERKIRQYKSRIKTAAKSGDREKARKLSLDLSDYVKENAAKAMEYKREHPTKEPTDE